MLKCSHFIMVKIQRIFFMSTIATFKAAAEEAARRFDLSEASYKNFWRKLFALKGAMGDKAIPVLDELVSIAADRTTELMKDVFGSLQLGGAQIHHVLDSFITPDTKEMPLGTGDKNHQKRRVIEKTKKLIHGLLTLGIYADDLRIYVSTPLIASTQTKPYVIFEIPRLKKQIALCDENGQATFVAPDILPLDVWARSTKSELENDYNVERFVYGDTWLERIQKFLLDEDPALNSDKFPKIVLERASRTFLLTENIILIKALEYAMENQDVLPTQTSGPVKGLPGQTWGAWNKTIRHQYRGLTRRDVTGLSHLLQIYGLKRGSIEDKDAITSAIKRLKETGQHGLETTPPFRNCSTPPLT